MSNSKKIVTLGDLGQTLPIGVFSEGQLHRDFASRPWRMKEERQIGELRAQNANANMGQYVAMLLSIMLTELGPYKDFESKKEHERRMIISQMFLPDVFYMFLYLRRLNIGRKLEFEPRCIRCATSFPYFGNLDTLEVSIVEDFDSAKWKYELHTPINIRNQAVSEFTIGPPRWNAFESVGGKPDWQLNTGAAKFTMIKSSIYSVGDIGEVALADHELDEMVKRDIEVLSRRIDEETPGPKMILEGNCPKCGRGFKYPIEWWTDGFFESSGQ